MRQNGSKEEFFSSEDHDLLSANHLGGFDLLWRARLQWFEAPNYRRSGWSGAARHQLLGVDGKKIGVFIKRQENHLRRTWRNPTGVPTFRVEWENLKKLTHYGIPVPLPLYYGEREFEGRPQAILITYELTGFSALDEWLQEHPADRSRRALLPPLADTIRRLHDHRFRHNCLYPKHILIRAENEGGPSTPEVRLIDLEKSRRVFSPMGARIRDLDSLLRRCPQWSEHEKNLFLSYYLNAGLEKLDPADLAARLGQYPLVEWIKKRIAVKQS